MAKGISLCYFNIAFGDVELTFFKSLATVVSEVLGEKITFLGGLTSEEILVCTFPLFMLLSRFSNFSSHSSPLLSTSPTSLSLLASHFPHFLLPCLAFSRFSLAFIFLSFKRVCIFALSFRSCLLFPLLLPHVIIVWHEIFGLS